MSEKTIHLTLPKELHDRLLHRAEAVGRSLQKEIIEALYEATADASELPLHLTEALAPLPSCSDEELWHAARVRLPVEESETMESLNRKRSHQGLEDAEACRLARLRRLADRVMLVRAEAAVLLKQRGHDVSRLWDRS
jgi:hypothetical protein